jgi:hypothetical protein
MRCYILFIDAIWMFAFLDTTVWLPEKLEVWNSFEFILKGFPVTAGFRRLRPTPCG